MGMWYGQDLSIGLSAVVPGPIPVTITLAWVSVLSTHTFGDRVALSVGMSLQLPRRCSSLKSTRPPAASSWKTC